MKTVLSVFTTTALALTVFTSHYTQAAIYGADDRKDIHQVPHLLNLAGSIAVTVPKHFIKEINSTQLKIESVQSYGQSSVVCPNERFLTQPVLDIGTCTGFLIKDKYLITAGHCILPNGIVNDDSSHPFCEAFSWYFNFNTGSGTQTLNQTIDKKQIVGCKRIIRAENIASGNDFAVIELDRNLGHALTARSTEAQLSEKVFAIGHPFGLPAKFSGLSPVHSAQSPIFFKVNLDSAGGNSGSPVFDVNNKVVGILTDGHPLDFVPNRKSQCNNLNRCNNSGTQCLEDSKFPGQTTSNLIQRLSHALKYLP